MKTVTIEITKELDEKLRAMASGFGATHESVIRELIKGRCEVTDSADSADDLDSIKYVVKSPLFNLTRSGKEKYIVILEYLYSRDPDNFANVLTGNYGHARDYFSKRKMRASDAPVKLDGSPIWALTNLSHSGQRNTLSKVMRILGYPNDDINIVLECMPVTVKRKKSGGADDLFDARDIMIHTR